jgi:hypothetical protein
MMKNLSRRALPMAAPATKVAIEAEIEKGDGYIQPNQTRSEIVGQEVDHRAMAQQEGNPNLDQIKDVHRTKDKGDSEATSHRTQPDK